ncbi:MAG: type II toxin-antitoxin system VapC family toxin [Anaerolineae bacterium]
MSRCIAIDSNVLVALVDRRDKWHQQALALVSALKAEDAALVYFDCVLNEAISVMARRAQEQKRSAEFPGLLDELLRQVSEDMVTWVSVDTRRLFRQIVDLVSSTGGLLNFHDSLIVLSCRELGIEAIASFDEDFDQIEDLVRIPGPSTTK